MIESKRPLSVDDMPALAICFKALRNLKYGQDLKIVAHIPTTATLNTLKMGFIQIEDRLVHLKRLSLHPMMSTSTIRKHCFVLNFRFKEKHLTNIVEVYKLWDMFFTFGLFKLTFMTGKVRTDMVSEPTLYVTSHKNSYGSTTSHWYDGVVDPIELKLGKYQLLQITQTREYSYLEGTCSDKSFAECTASKLTDCNTCQENG